MIGFKGDVMLLAVGDLGCLYLEMLEENLTVGFSTVIDFSRFGTECLQHRTLSLA